MTDSAPTEPTEAPATGQPDVDAALRSLSDLGQRPLDEHHDRLSAAHETLHDALQNPSGGAPDPAAGPSGGPSGESGERPEPA